MDKENKIEILILAAGKGKRMKSELPKVLHKVKDKPMIRHIIESIKKLGKKPIAIVGHKADLVKSELNDLCHYAFQEELLGTGHAISCAKDACAQAEHVVVLSGDQPLITEQTVRNLINKHLESKSKITFTTTILPDFESWRKNFISFGRVIRENGRITGIKEYKDATEEEKNIKEVNAGCYAFESEWLWKNLEKIKNDNIQKEYYLTDLFKIASDNGDKIESITISAQEALGANTIEELQTLEDFAKRT